ncbi:MOSC domain-containing protein [Catenuloplanes atrovinosus]|uniref:MOSC domain-containing protein YiiM n=1 Tax=Catenuloplanes atrovinosus TaxID=137266 RepID=A0AAE3YKA0_9ACTN|nr:MOSC domain-containing protein [Catenuloplanes atrovinosus]MDR7274015.1 MOSC domain-containing protein YiiM [Catenuloplanes atrovinosus]
MAAHVLSVNLAVPRRVPGTLRKTGIDKRPVEGPVLVRAPGDRATGAGSGLQHDEIFDNRHHGGDDQAVYAYAREDLDAWAAELGRELPGGVFGENLTTTGLDITHALIGERWRVGADLVLEVSVPREPCTTFARWMDVPGWLKTFTRRALPGTYLRVVTPGEVRAGDEIVVEHRPEHEVTVGLAFRAMTLERELLPRLLDAPALPARTLAAARKYADRLAATGGPTPEA